MQECILQKHLYISSSLSQQIIKFVYVIARAGVKFGINFTSCSENGNVIARGAAEFYFAIIAGIYPKILLLPMLSQINTIASFVKVKISDF